MQRLNRGMLRRYDIPEHAPAGVRAVQFGLGKALLGVADRLLDAACPSLGIACVPPAGPWTGGGADPAALLPVVASAEIVKSGPCGKNGYNLKWTLDDEGTLTISGTGEMKDYNYSWVKTSWVSTVPWGLNI